MALLYRMGTGNGSGGSIPQDYERIKISVSTYVGGKVSDLYGKAITLYDVTDSTTESITIDSSVIYAYMPKNHIYYLEYPSVNGYKKPNNSARYTAVGGNENAINITFEQWMATIELSWLCENSISWTLKKGTTIIDSGSATSNGSKTISVYEIGTYTITSTVDGETASESIEVTELKTYNLFISADYVTLNITTDDTELQNSTVKVYLGTDNTGTLLDTVTLVNGVGISKLGKSKVGDVTQTAVNLYVYEPVNDVDENITVNAFSEYNVELMLAIMTLFKNGVFFDGSTINDLVKYTLDTYNTTGFGCNISFTEKDDKSFDFSVSKRDEAQYIHGGFYVPTKIPKNIPANTELVIISSDGTENWMSFTFQANWQTKVNGFGFTTTLPASNRYVEFWGSDGWTEPYNGVNTNGESLKTNNTNDISADTVYLGFNIRGKSAIGNIKTIKLVKAS